MTQTFAIIPASMKPFWIIAPVFLILIGVMVLLTATIAGSRNSRFEVGPAGLTLRGDLYGRTIPAAQLRPDSARIVNLHTDPQIKVGWRRIGTALPGYLAGWFRLKNGEKALLYVTDRTRVVYVPTTAGYSVLVSPQDPEGFLAALRNAAR